MNKRILNSGTTHRDLKQAGITPRHANWRRLAAVGIIAGLTALSACNHSDEDKKPGQTLARVNGDEVTVHQLNEELRQTPAKDGSPENQRKQMLEALIDRQLLVAEAVHDKLDRDPTVVQAIERAKAQILAQAYLQSKMAGVAKPDKAEIEAYFQAHQEYFAQRKLFDMREFVLSTKDFSKELNTLMDGAKSLDEVAAWLDAHKVAYAKSQAVHTSNELPEQIVNKMQGPDKTELFILHNDTKTMLISVTAVKDVPVGLDAATPEIVQYLSTKKNQDAAETELKRLRAAAKIQYLNTEAVAGTESKSADKPQDKPAAPVEAANTSQKSDVDPQSLK